MKVAKEDTTEADVAKATLDAGVKAAHEAIPKKEVEFKAAEK